eukprot:s38_g9.t1
MSRRIEFKHIEHLMINFPRVHVTKATAQIFFARNCGAKTRRSTVVLSWRVRVTLDLPTAFHYCCFLLRRLSRRCTIAAARPSSGRQAAQILCILLWETVGTDTKQLGLKFSSRGECIGLLTYK